MARTRKGTASVDLPTDVAACFQKLLSDGLVSAGAWDVNDPPPPPPELESEAPKSVSVQADARLLAALVRAVCGGELKAASAAGPKAARKSSGRAKTKSSGRPKSRPRAKGKKRASDR